MTDHENIPADGAATTEEKILQAAEREFLRKGFAGARTTAIAEAAGVTHAMLHYYFRTKDNLFVRIVTNKAELLGEIFLMPSVDESVPLFDKITKIVGQHFDFIAANPDLPRFMINEVFARPQRVAKFGAVMCERLPKVLDALQRQIDSEAAAGRCRRVEAPQLLIDIVSLNIFPILAGALIENIYGGRTEDDRKAFLTARKRENIETVIRKLEP